MGKITVIIDDELDERFRNAIFRAKGWRKGNLTEAVEEALELWIKEKKQTKKEIPKIKT